ncbi:MAG: hypothetical protein H6626_07850 [Pseudobdellovibrionaceae bacterium]|nr:hypothetical protein [Bdellovibrionales bacterium]USN46138.1 MAG: hypothetical protein H6626_07850 [Pseudobdellovibrionaceae bacterium]
MKLTSFLLSFNLKFIVRILTVTAVFCCLIANADTSDDLLGFGCNEAPKSAGRDLSTMTVLFQDSYAQLDSSDLNIQDQAQRCTVFFAEEISRRLLGLADHRLAGDLESDALHPYIATMRTVYGLLDENPDAQEYLVAVLTEKWLHDYLPILLSEQTADAKSETYMVLGVVGGSAGFFALSKKLRKIATKAIRLIRKSLGHSFKSGGIRHFAINGSRPIALFSGTGASTIGHESSKSRLEPLNLPSFPPEVLDVPDSEELSKPQNLGKDNARVELLWLGGALGTGLAVTPLIVNGVLTAGHRAKQVIGPLAVATKASGGLQAARASVSNATLSALARIDKAQRLQTLAQSLRKTKLFTSTNLLTVLVGAVAVNKLADLADSYAIQSNLDRIDNDLERSFEKIQLAQTNDDMFVAYRESLNLANQLSIFMAIMGLERSATISEFYSDIRRRYLHPQYCPLGRPRFIKLSQLIADGADDFSKDLIALNDDSTAIQSRLSQFHERLLQIDSRYVYSATNQIGHLGRLNQWRRDPNRILLAIEYQLKEEAAFYKNQIRKNTLSRQQIETLIECPAADPGGA